MLDRSFLEAEYRLQTVRKIVVDGDYEGWTRVWADDISGGSWFNFHPEAGSLADAHQLDQNRAWS